MAISFIRVDDRMIHGQTVTRWPCFIVLTMKDSGFKTGAFEIRPRCGLRIFEGLSKYLIPILFIDTILISVCLAVGYMGAHWINNMAFTLHLSSKDENQGEIYFL